jgi:peptidoglycan/xylan/chitin deacetylase (PgdA/CDA1 family)
VALTLDDGPSPLSTSFVDVLQSKGAPASFFVVANRIANYPGVLRRMVDGGQTVGSHSLAHAHPAQQSAEALLADNSRSDELITAETGLPVTLYRPPYGERSDAITAVSGQLGLAQILWNVDSLDWQSRDANKVVEQVMTTVRPGSIILTHDLYQSTLDAYPILIDRLREAGYVIVTIPELLGGASQAGVTYFSGLAPPA